MELDTVLVTAYAKAPQQTAYYEIYKYVGVVLEIDIKTHIVVDASATFMTPTAQNYFSRLVVGTNFEEEISGLLERVKKHYLAPSQNSLLVALKVAHQRYADSLRCL